MGEAFAGGGAKEDGQLSEFRQQVAVLRSIGGSDWLRLLNRLQNDRPREYASDATCYQATDNPEGIAGRANVAQWEAAQDDNERCVPECGLPEWLSSFNPANPAFRERLQTLARGNVPEWSLWCTLLSRDGQQMLTCAVGNCMGLSFLRPTSTIQRDDLNATPEFECTASVTPSSMVGLFVGPRHSYIELRVGSEFGVESLVLLPASPVDATRLVRDLATTFGLEARRKYASHEVERCALESCGGSEVKFAERVLLSDARRGTVTFAVVVPPFVAVVEDNVFRAANPFAVRGVWDTRLGVADVQLRDEVPVVVSASSLPSSSSSPSSLDSLLTCGYHVVMKLERGSDCRLRFQTRDSRSCFLEAFLAARNVEVTC